MRTSRRTGAAALLLAWAMAGPAAAQVNPQPERCPEPGLGPPAACIEVEDGGPGTTVPDEPAESEPGPALWIGAVFGVSGLAGMVFATARVRDTELAGGP